MAKIAAKKKRKCYKVHWFNSHINKYSDRANICDDCLDRYGILREIIGSTREPCEQCGYDPKNGGDKKW